MKIAIIGAGIVGAAYAYELTRQGADVVLVDRALPGNGTSGATAAYLNFLRKQPDHYAALHVQALAHWQRLVGAIDAGHALHLDGSLYWTGAAIPSAGDWHLLPELARRAERLGQPTEHAGRQDLAPTLRLPDATPALNVPGEGWVDVPVVIERLLAAATRFGLRALYGSAVEAIERQPGRIVLHAGKTRIEADKLVIAAGPQAAEIGQLLGLALPVLRKPGLVATTTPLAQPLRHVVFSPGLSFRPAPGNRALIAVGERYAASPGDASAAARQALDTALLQALGQWVPGTDGVRIESLAIGVRPIPEDELPLVGFLPGLPEVYLSVSHSGINLGPLFAHLGSNELLRGELAPELEPYRPERLVRGH
jgi:D-hydroxyproline dehydrogenase subunit beta